MGKGKRPPSGLTASMRALGRDLMAVEMKGVWWLMSRACRGIEGTVQPNTRYAIIFISMEISFVFIVIYFRRHGSHLGQSIHIVFSPDLYS